MSSLNEKINQKWGRKKEEIIKQGFCFCDFLLILFLTNILKQSFSKIPIYLAKSL